MTAIYTALAVLIPKPDKQGLHLGPNHWLSYDYLMGWHGDDGPSRDAFWKRPENQRFLEWVESLKDIHANLDAIHLPNPQTK